MTREATQPHGGVCVVNQGDKVTGVETELAIILGLVAVNGTGKLALVVNMIRMMEMKIIENLLTEILVIIIMQEFENLLKKQQQRFQ